MNDPILPPPMHPAATVASDEPDAELIDERERETITDAIRAWGMRRDARCVALCDEVYAARGAL